MLLTNKIRQVARIAWRECGILRRNPIYWFCMVAFPLLVTFFFTSMMLEGQPTDMPVGVVDLDNTSTSRQLVRRLDGFQLTRVVAHYPSVAEARKAMQRDDIYAFLYIPRGMSEKLLASRRPSVSFYYNMSYLAAGTLLYRDLTTITTLGSASVGMATLQAKGASPGQIQAFLQPIVIDLHQLSNPWANYNIYLSAVLVPGVIMLFIFLVTAYSLGTELKFKRSRQWMSMADGNIVVAIAGKMLPQTLVFLAIVYGYMYYVFGVLGFPHPGGTLRIALLGLATVLASQGFGIFVFGIMPSLRMSMSVCSLWAVLGFSMAGSAYPVMAMDTPLQALSWLFPLRHYFMIYQITVFNGYDMLDAWLNLTAMAAFALLPLLVLRNIRTAMRSYVYIP